MGHVCPRRHFWIDARHWESLEKLVARKVIGPTDRVVVVSTAHGLKFTEFKTRYHEGALGFESRWANQPVSLGSDPLKVSEALHRALDARERA